MVVGGGGIIGVAYGKHMDVCRPVYGTCTQQLYLLLSGTVICVCRKVAAIGRVLKPREPAVGRRRCRHHPTYEVSTALCAMSVKCAWFCLYGVLNSHHTHRFLAPHGAPPPFLFSRPPVCDALVEAGIFPEGSPPNHVLLNEYSEGQGIGECTRRPSTVAKDSCSVLMGVYRFVIIATRNYHPRRRFSPALSKRNPPPPFITLPNALSLKTGAFTVLRALVLHRRRMAPLGVHGSQLLASDQSYIPAWSQTFCCSDLRSTRFVAFFVF